MSEMIRVLRKGRIGLGIEGVGRDADRAAEVIRAVIRESVAGNLRVAATILHADELHVVVAIPDVITGDVSVYLQYVAAELRDAIMDAFSSSAVDRIRADVRIIGGGR